MTQNETFRLSSVLSGISATNAEEMVRKPDRNEVIEHDGILLQLFTKYVTKTSPPSYGLVIVEQMPKGPPALTMVWKVYENLTSNVSELSPTTLLRRFIDRFGCDVRIGQTVKKLFLAEYVPVGSLDPQKEFATSVSARDIAGLRLFRIKADPLRASCVLCFAADVDAYRAYVQAKGGRPV